MYKVLFGVAALYLFAGSVYATDVLTLTLKCHNAQEISGDDIYFEFYIDGAEKPQVFGDDLQKGLSREETAQMRAKDVLELISDVRKNLVFTKTLRIVVKEKDATPTGEGDDTLGEVVVKSAEESSKFIEGGSIKKYKYELKWTTM